MMCGDDLCFQQTEQILLDILVSLFSIVFLFAIESDDIIYLCTAHKLLQPTLKIFTLDEKTDFLFFMLNILRFNVRMSE